MREDKSSGLRAVFHSEFLASRRFSDISDYAPVLELLAMGKGEKGAGWMMWVLGQNSSSFPGA